MRWLILLVLLGVLGCNDTGSTDSVEKEVPIEKKTEPKGNREIIEKDKQPNFDDIPVEIAPDKHLNNSLQSGFLEKSKYDPKIRKEVQRWLPFVDWSIVKAQFYQESKLNPEAESGVGAKGIAQFMPATWQEMKADLDLGDVSRTNPDISIMAGIYYDSKLWQYWKAERPHYHRVAFMLASYNAGTGNLLKAQKACGGSNLFDEVFTCLPEITGHHAEETEGYVDNIFNFYVIHKLN